MHPQMTPPSYSYLVNMPASGGRQPLHQDPLSHMKSPAQAVEMGVEVRRDSQHKKNRAWQTGLGEFHPDQAGRFDLNLQSPIPKYRGPPFNEQCSGTSPKNTTSENAPPPPPLIHTTPLRPHVASAGEFSGYTFAAYSHTPTNHGRMPNGYQQKKLAPQAPHRIVATEEISIAPKTTAIASGQVEYLCVLIGKNLEQMHKQ
jgi:hypothetical protein